VVGLVANAPVTRQVTPMPALHAAEPLRRHRDGFGCAATWVKATVELDGASEKPASSSLRQRGLDACQQDCFSALPASDHIAVEQPVRSSPFNASSPLDGGRSMQKANERLKPCPGCRLPCL